MKWRVPMCKSKSRWWSVYSVAPARCPDNRFLSTRLQRSGKRQASCGKNVGLFVASIFGAPIGYSMWNNKTLQFCPTIWMRSAIDVTRLYGKLPQSRSYAEIPSKLSSPCCQIHKEQPVLIKQDDTLGHKCKVGRPTINTHLP